MHARADEIVARANEYVGTRYRQWGRSMTSGVDCIGLIICVGRDLGLTDHDTTTYSSRPNVPEFDRFMIDGGYVLRPYSELSHGDIIRLSAPKWPVHSAIVEVDEHGDPWFIHAYLPYRKVAKERLTSGADMKLSSVWSYPL